MIGLFRATWVTLRRPTLLAGAFGAAAALSALITVVTFATAGQGAAAPPGAPELAWTTARLAGASGMSAGVTAATGAVGAVAFCVAGAVLAGRFSTGGVRNLLLREPDRLRFLAGSWAALTAFAAGLAAVACAVGSLTAVAVAGRHGIATGTWFTGRGLGEAARAWACLGLAAIGYACLGMVLATVLRGPVLTLVAGLGWLLVVELVVGDTAAVARWLPGRLLAVIAAGGTASVSFVASLATLTGYLLVGAVLAGLSVTRRDITA